MKTKKRKKALITGIANDKSIAWNIAKFLNQEGVETVLTCQSEKHWKRAQKLASSIETELIICDFCKDKEVSSLFSRLKNRWNHLDILIHSLAYADVEFLEQDFSKCTRQSFLHAVDTGVYSLITSVNKSIPLMKNGGSIITLSYYGAHKVMPNYHIMGTVKAALESAVRYLAVEVGRRNIRINIISAGPVKTISSSALPYFQDKLDLAEKKAPLAENISQEDIAEMAVFLSSDRSKHITGSTFYVDSGLHILGA